MPMLAFFPWLKIREPIRIGPFHVFPHAPGTALPGEVAASCTQGTIAAILSQYRAVPGSIVPSLALLQYDGRPLGDELGQQERDAVFRFGRHLAVSGMCERAFLGAFPDDYSASGHYQLAIQMFNEPYRGSVNVTHRRKGGHTSIHMGQTDVHFVLPPHLVEQAMPAINVPLLHALEALHALADPSHVHVAASVSQFLLSNSDSSDVPPDVETTAAYSALERLADASDIKSVRQRLLGLLDHFDQSRYAVMLRRSLPTFEAGRPEFARWIAQLYKVRGRLAHGKSADAYNSDWSTFEHGVAAALAYPLLLKALVIELDLYEPSKQDVARALGLEGLLTERPFFAERSPADPDEFEYRVRGRSGWIQRFDAIHSALLNIELMALLRDDMA